MAQQPPEFIDQLANVIYSQESIERANQYVKSREIDPAKFRFPWAFTSMDLTNFYQFRPYYPPEIFTDCLYIPITAVNNSKQLVGFDVRYLGSLEHRLRYVKLKKTPDTLLMYSTHDFAGIKIGTPFILTEGAMDAESLRCLGYPVISPLTAQSQLRFCVFLRALSEKIYIAYDNDESGRRAVQKIMKQVSIDTEIQKGFMPLVYSGKDPNSILMNYGTDHIKLVLGSQLI